MKEMFEIKKIVFIMYIFMCIFGADTLASKIKNESIKSDVAAFRMNINHEIFNSDNRFLPREGSLEGLSNDMSLCEYPAVMYENITYLPLTYYNCALLGLKLEAEDNKVLIKQANSDFPAEYLKDQSGDKKERITVTACPFDLNIFGKDYSDEKYPALFYKNIVYLPLTWNVVNGIMHWDYSFGENGIELYTDSYYYYSEGDSTYELSDSGTRASTSYGKTYYRKDGKAVFAALYHQRIGGPTGENMTVFNGNKEYKIPGCTGYGQKKGPVFLTDGEWIYTTHSDYTRFGKCRISISTGEIIYEE